MVYTKRKENFTAKFGFVSNSCKQGGFVQASYTTYLQRKQESQGLQMHLMCYSIVCIYMHGFIKSIASGRNVS